MAYVILVLESGTKPASLPEAKSLNHWAATEVLNIIFRSSPTGLDPSSKS